MVNSNEKFRGKLRNKNIHEKLHTGKLHIKNYTYRGKLHMQEVKISLPLGEITHDLGEKKTLRNTVRKCTQIQQSVKKNCTFFVRIFKMIAHLQNLVFREV